MEYRENGIEFYFLITKGEYDSRGRDSKIAIAVCEYPFSCEVFNQQDTRIPLKTIPYLDEITIPGVDLDTITDMIFCCECGKSLGTEEVFFGPQDDCYCEECFNLLYFKCTLCNKIESTSVAFFEDENGDRFCFDCYNTAHNFSIANASARFSYEIKSDKPVRQFGGVVSEKTELIRRLVNILSELPMAACANVKIEIISMETGEIIFEGTGKNTGTINEIEAALKSW